LRIPKKVQKLKVMKKSYDIDNNQCQHFLMNKNKVKIKILVS
jgi:hypothetical protein